ncbi:MAG: lytic transglycosylase domain-containing protein [Nitrospirota bacterium]|nr:lytic transglycosylase domain-containing protein [Nitrospirota bacterium]
MYKWYIKDMSKLLLTGTLILLITAYGATVCADIYKYVDKNGVTHFTNIPKNNEYKKIMNDRGIETYNDYDYIINRKSVKYNIKPAIIRAVITAESNWDTRAVSKKGAIGLMQLMPTTARDMRIDDPYDPEQNIEGGTRYLRLLLNRFNENLHLALAAYNAGPERVARTGGIPSISETRNYVKTVLSIYKGRAGGNVSGIEKVVSDNGTIIYTNTPSNYKQPSLSNF